VFLRAGRRHGPGVDVRAGLPPVVVVVLSHYDPPPVAGERLSPERVLASSVMSDTTGCNPLWGSSPVNQDSYVNPLSWFQLPHPDDDVVDVYRDPDFLQGGPVGRFRS
jgi:hypothetical protein